MHELPSNAKSFFFLLVLIDISICRVYGYLATNLETCYIDCHFQTQANLLSIASSICYALKTSDILTKALQRTIINCKFYRFYNISQQTTNVYETFYLVFRKTLLAKRSSEAF